jgi:hypothetical protein
MKKVYGDRFIRRPYYKYLDEEYTRGVMDRAQLRARLMRRWALPSFFADEVIARWLRMRHGRRP